MATNLKTKKQEVFKYVELNLGGGMIDVELDPDHYETALQTALTKFRQKSDNSVEESYMFLPTVIDQNDYTLPSEVIEVRKLFRRSIGSRTGGGGGGTLFEPFNLAYTNTYLLASSNMGGLATYNAFAGKSGYETSHLYTLQVDEKGKTELVTADTSELDASTQNELADRINQTPEREGYEGYLIGDGIAPNGEAFGSGIGFPTGSVKGDYFLRTDLFPNRLFRYDGQRWVKMEDNVRVNLSNTDNKQTQKGTFINNTNSSTIGGDTVKERQSLSDALKAKPDNT